MAVMDADGANLDVIASDPDLCQSDASYTPDGSRLVYVRFDSALEVERDLEHEGRRLRPALHHGRRRTRSERLAGRPEAQLQGPADGALFVANIDGSGVDQISPSISVTYKHDWAPDGQHLVVSDNSDPAPDESVNVVTVRPDGSDWTYLTHYPAGFRANVGGYSPDGQWIVFRLEGPGLVPTMFRIRPDGSDLHAIFASSTIVPRFIDWGPAVTR